MSDAHQPEVDLVHPQAVVPKNSSPKEFKTLNFKAYKYNETGLTLVFNNIRGKLQSELLQRDQVFPFTCINFSLLVQQIDSFTLF